MSVPMELRSLKGFQGAEGDTALGTLEKQLLCPICLDIFTKPVVILPCQHNLCRKCANDLYQPSLYQARTTMSVSSGRFRCPTCRQEVVLDRHGVYGLQRNLLVENIIDVYKQEVSNNSNNNTCCSLPPPQPQAPVTTCADHEGEKVNIFCLSCQVPTCSLCKVFGAHQSCEVAPLPDVYKQRKAELNEGVDSLVVVNLKVQAFINDLEDSCKNIEENCKTQKQRLCERFERMFSILKERRKVMTQKISSEEEEKTGHVQSLVRCYGDSVQANTRLMETVGRSMEEPDTADFVQNSRELIAKVMTATSSCPVETLKADYENMSHYTFNFKHQERALHSIDFIKEEVPEEPELESDPEPHLDEPQSGALQQPLESTVQNFKTKHLRLLEPAIQNLELKQPKEPIVLKHFESIKLPVLTIQNMEAKLASNPTVQNLEKHPAPLPALKPPPKPSVSSPVPAQTTVPVVSIIDSVGPMEPVRELKSDGQVLEDQQGVSLSKKDEEGEEKKIENVAQPDPVKVIRQCEEQDGMSMQQFERGKAEHGTGDEKAINHAQTVSKEEEQMEAQEEEDGSVEKEEEHAMFCPSWYRPNTWHRVSPGLASPTDILPTEDQIYSPDSSFAGEPLPVAVTQAKAQGSALMRPQLQEQVQGSSLLPQFNIQEPPPLAPSVSAVQAQPKPQILFEPQPESFPQQQNMYNSQQYPQEEPPLSSKSLTPDLRLFDHTQAQAYPPFSASLPATQLHSQPPIHPVPTGLGHSNTPSLPEGLTRELAGDIEPMEEENEGEDIQGWVYLSGAEEGGSGEGSMEVEENSSRPEESSTNSEGITKSTSVEGNGAGLQLQGRFLELGEDGSLENDKNREGLKESASGMGCNAEATEMTDGPGERSVEPEERSAELDKDSLGLVEHSIPMEESSCNLVKHKLDLSESIGGGSTAEESQEQDSSVEEGRDSELEAGNSGFKQSNQELDEIRKQPEDSNSKMEEASGDESGVNPTSSVSPQIIMVFYLLALLVILQRIWAYIGFILT